MTECVRPLPGPARDYAFPAVERAKLENGMRIVVARMPRLPIVTVLALFDTGASADAPGREGLAMLTAAALGEGTRRLEGEALTGQFERLGTGFDAGADWDCTMAHLSVTPTRLAAAMQLLAEVLTEPAFRPRDVERLKSVRLADLLQQKVEPRGLADEEFAKAIFLSGSRYGIEDGGSEESVRELSGAWLLDYHAESLTPDALTLVFVGDVTVERAQQLSRDTMGAWRGSAKAARQADDATRRSGRRVLVVNKTDAPQSELRVGHRGVPRHHEDYFPIVVMNALLGGLFSSRINLNLRERNAYTYGARSAFEWRRSAGPFVVSTAVKTEVTAAATREILLEIERMRAEPVTADELSLAIDYLAGVFPLRFETTNAVASAIAVATTFELSEDYYTTYRDRIHDVSARDVLRVAGSHLHPEELLVLAVGNASEIRSSLELLNVGGVEVSEPTNTLRGNGA